MAEYSIAGLSNEDLFNIVEHLPYATGIFGIDLTYRYFNPAGEAMSGIPLSKAMGKKVTELLPPEVYNTFLPFVEEAIASKKAVEKEIRLSFGQDALYLKLNYVPILDSKNQVTCVLGITQDVSSRRFIENQLNLAEALANTGSWRFTIQNNSIWTSNQASILLKLPARVSHSIEDFLGPFVGESRLLLKECFETCQRNGAPFDGEFEILSADSKIRYLRIIGKSEKFADAVIAISGAMQDISQSKSQAIQLQMALSSARKADRAKSEFLANVSHEIRTPLNAIAGFSELLSEPSLLPASTLTQLYARIKFNVDHLTNLISGILDMSQVESAEDQMVRSRIRLSQLVGEIEALSIHKAKEKNLTFSVICKPDGDYSVSIDHKRTLQIVGNLVENAIKYTEKGFVQVGIDFKYAQNQVIHLIINVDDSGVGMSGEAQTEIFRPFYQADNSATKVHGGMGLGLALAKKFAQQQGGDLRLAWSEPRKGSGFELTISNVEPTMEGSKNFAGPKIMEATLTSPSQTASSRGLADLKILVIEDNLDNQLLFTKILNGSGAQVEIAADGRKGLDQGRSRTYDAIVVDINIPIMDGLEVTQLLRANGCKVPIVAVTGLATNADRERCFKAGCDAFLTKPVRKTEFIECLEKLVENQ